VRGATLVLSLPLLLLPSDFAYVTSGDLDLFAFLNFFLVTSLDQLQRPDEGQGQDGEGSRAHGGSSRKVGLLKIWTGKKCKFWRQAILTRGGAREGGCRRGLLKQANRCNA
jgi:hypothetical protein